MPLWTLDALLAVPNPLEEGLSDNTIMNRCRLVGPVFRNIFEQDYICTNKTADWNKQVRGIADPEYSFRRAS